MINAVHVLNNAIDHLPYFHIHVGESKVPNALAISHHTLVCHGSDSQSVVQASNTIISIGARAISVTFVHLVVVGINIVRV